MKEKQLVKYTYAKRARVLRPEAVALSFLTEGASIFEVVYTADGCVERDGKELEFIDMRVYIAPPVQST